MLEVKNFRPMAKINVHSNNCNPTNRGSVVDDTRTSTADDMPAVLTDFGFCVDYSFVLSFMKFHGI